MELLYSSKIKTPAYVYSEKDLISNLEIGKSIAEEMQCEFLYSMKSLEYRTALEAMLPYVSGFAASSLFEAKLGREIIGENGTIHYTTPGLRDREMYELAELCDYMSLNSANHWKRLSPLLKDKTKLGIRINPNISLVDDERYDPCAKDSRLGMHIPEIRMTLKKHPELLDNISGFHIHTNCEGIDFNDLLRTILKVSNAMGDLLDQVEWFNIGGGYFFKEAENHADFKTAIDLLQSRHNLKVFMEPGGTIVRSAGYIVATVIDIVGPSSSKIAVLDTSVNHMPEVYEYGYEPDIIGDVDDDSDIEHTYDYILAGASCLAGDKFGTYSFEKPLKIGQRIIFENIGSYSMVKSHMFNGINLPNVYFITKDNELKLDKEYTYEDFLSRCAASSLRVEQKNV